MLGRELLGFGSGSLGILIVVESRLESLELVGRSHRHRLLIETWHPVPHFFSEAFLGFGDLGCGCRSRLRCSRSPRSRLRRSRLRRSLLRRSRLRRGLRRFDRLRRRRSWLRPPRRERLRRRLERLRRRRGNVPSTKACSSRGTSWLLRSMTVRICRPWKSSRSVRKVTAVPECPARPVLPILCT